MDRTRGSGSLQCLLGQDLHQQHSWFWLHFLEYFSSNLNTKNTDRHTLRKGHHLLHQADSLSETVLPASLCHQCLTTLHGGSVTNQVSPSRCMAKAYHQQVCNGNRPCRLYLRCGYPLAARDHTAAYPRPLWHYHVGGRPWWWCTMSAPCTFQHEGRPAWSVQSMKDSMPPGDCS